MASICPPEDVVGDEALAGVVADDEVEDVPLAVDLDAALEQLLEEDGEQGVAGAVGGVDGAGGGVAAEAPLRDAAVVHAGEGAAHVLELEDVLRRLAAQDLGGVLVDEEVAALDGVVHVQLPRVVVGGVAERGGDAALGRAGVGSQRVHLGEDGDVDAGVRGDFERGAHPGETGPDDQDVVLEHSDLSRRRGPAAAGRAWAGAIVHRASGAFNLPAIWGIRAGSAGRQRIPAPVHPAPTPETHAKGPNADWGPEDRSVDDGLQPADDLVHIVEPVRDGHRWHVALVEVLVQCAGRAEENL